MCSVNQGACGLNCAGCDAFIAYKNNDEALRQKVAKEWSEMYQANLKPEDINCVGCMQEGIKIGHCAECEIRACVTSKSLQHCAECTDFPCNTIDNFMNMVPIAKENLMKLRSV